MFLSRFYLVSWSEPVTFAPRDESERSWRIVFSVQASIQCCQAKLSLLSPSSAEGVVQSCRTDVTGWLLSLVTLDEVQPVENT